MQHVMRLAPRAQTGWGGLDMKAPTLEQCYDAVESLPERAKIPKKVQL